MKQPTKTYTLSHQNCISISLKTKHTLEILSLELHFIFHQDLQSIQESVCLRKIHPAFQVVLGIEAVVNISIFFNLI